MIYFYI